MQTKIKDKINFVFWGTPDVAFETLEIFKKSGYIPSLIITSPDKPQGRKMMVTPPPVKIWAMKNNVPYIQPEKLTEEKIDIALRTSSQADFFLVVAYGKIIPEKILNMPRLGSINIHYSLLPKYRGASPVESAILNDEKETGVTIQKMIYKLDTGGILVQEKTNILPDETAPELRKRLIKQGGELLVKILPEILQNKISSVPQDETLATYCKKIKKEDGLVDLKGDPIKNYNKFRAYFSWPRTFFFQDGKRIIITDAVLEDNLLDKTRGKQFVVKKVLPESKKEIKYEKFEKQIK